jgi:hypothetical protein
MHCDQRRHIPLPSEWFLSNMPKAELEGHNLGASHVVGPYTCLVKTGKHMVLVDTGGVIAVNEYLEKDGPAPRSGDLLKHLRAEGIAHEQITDVTSMCAGDRRKSCKA